MIFFAERKQNTMAYMTIADTIGNTPLVQLKRIPGADALSLIHI